jgi:hypothetical protein
LIGPRLYLIGQVFLSQRGSLLVCNWLHSVGQNHFHVMMLFKQGFSSFRVFLFRVILLEDSTQILCQRNRIPCIRPDDVIFSPEILLSKHHSSRERELSVQTFLYVESLRIVPGCIHPDILATRPDPSQCSTRKRTSFQNTDLGRPLQPSRRCVFPSGRYP